MSVYLIITIYLPIQNIKLTDLQIIAWLVVQGFIQKYELNLVQKHFLDISSAI